MKNSATAGVGPYAFIVSFGLVSMLMDTVYEGALAVQGPLLASLGASALVVGIVSGLGEATALAGRLFSGPLADRTGRYWLFAILGYAITACAVPAMGFAGSLIGVSALVVIERFGKSLRTPSRDAMMSHAAAAWRGKGFALHEVMDQIGAMAGPLAVAALLTATGNDYRVALGILIIPGLAAIGVLLALRHRVPRPAIYEQLHAEQAQQDPQQDEPTQQNSQRAWKNQQNQQMESDAVLSTVAKSKSAAAKTQRATLPRVFWAYSIGCAVVLIGVATFGVVSYHIVSTGLASDALVPALYAVAMVVDGIFAALTGVLYDRLGTKVLLCLPVVCALIPLFAYANDLAWITVGVVLWGASLGIQESTMRAAVADIVPTSQRATAYGIFSVFVGAGALLGGVIAGGVYTVSPQLLAGLVIAIEAVAFVLLVRSTTTSHSEF